MIILRRKRSHNGLVPFQLVAANYREVCSTDVSFTEPPPFRRNSWNGISVTAQTNHDKRGAS